MSPPTGPFPAGHKSPLSLISSAPLHVPLDARVALSISCSSLRLQAAIYLSLACDHNCACDSYQPFCCGQIKWTLYFLYLNSFSLTLLPFSASSSTQPLIVDIPAGWGLGLWRPRRSAAQSFRESGCSCQRSRLGGPAAEFQQRPCAFWE